MSLVETTTLSPIKPLVTNRIFVDKYFSFTAACFGGKGDDWSLKPLQTRGDERSNYVFADRLASALSGIGAQCVYAPTPTKFNAEIISPNKLTNHISVGNGVYLRRNNKAPADGTFLQHPKDAGIFSAGGCGVIVAVYCNEVVFAHAGRECLLDRHWVKTEGRECSRDNVSVVDSMLDALRVTPEHLHEVQVWPLYFIKPEDFPHRADDTELDHAVYNPAAMRFLPKVYGKDCGTVTKSEIQMDLPGIARKQFIVRGVPAKNIHMEHQYLADELPTTRNGGGRYLVAIVRNS
jgi:hypothetical protein